MNGFDANSEMNFLRVAINESDKLIRQMSAELTTEKDLLDKKLKRYSKLDRNLADLDGRKKVIPLRKSSKPQDTNKSVAMKALDKMSLEERAELFESLKEA